MSRGAATCHAWPVASARQDGRRDRLFTRSADDRVLVGVAGGLGARLGVDALLLRLAFGVLAVSSGVGIAGYLVAWALSDEPDPAVPLTPAARRPRPRQIASLGCIVVGLLLMVRDLGLWLGDTVVWPIALGAAGSAVIWARSDERDRARWSRAGARLQGNPVEAVFGGRISPARVSAGGLLLAGGVALFVVSNSSLAAARTAILAMVATAAGLGLILGPWIMRLARQSSEDRRARIRSEERAEIAAHLHDSVLHTLLLVQRGEVSAEVVTLARQQERELRAWLNRDGRPEPEGDLRAAVDRLAADVERLHGVGVDAIVVGDATLDERLEALLFAAREAAVNAARHSGAGRVSLYVEAEPDSVTAFVRDTGCGFEVSAVPEDRRGLRESVIGRMRRHGGTASVVSQSGAGTEVQLLLPRLRNLP